MDTIVQHSVRLTLCKRRMVSFVFFLVSRALLCTHTPCLSTWLHLRFSYHMKILPIVVSIVSDNRNTSSVLKVKLFLELADVLFPEQCETSGGYWYKHYFDGASESDSFCFCNSRKVKIWKQFIFHRDNFYHFSLERQRLHHRLEILYLAPLTATEISPSLIILASLLALCWKTCQD